MYEYVLCNVDDWIKSIIQFYFFCHFVNLIDRFTLFLHKNYFRLQFDLFFTSFSWDLNHIFLLLKPKLRLQFSSDKKLIADMEAS